MRGDVDVQRSGTANNLSRLLGALTEITSEPGGAEIFVDGQARGRTPVHLDLPARSHELVAHLDGGLTNSKELMSSRNETTQRTLCSQMAA